MTDTEAGDWLRRHFQAEIEAIRQAPPVVPPPPEPINLPPAEPGSPLAEEWELFRREIAGLLANGHRGRFAVVKAGQLTTWDTLRDAIEAARLLHGNVLCLIQPVQPKVPASSPFRIGYRRLCRE